MEIYLEYLYHFKCEKCESWWSVGSVQVLVNEVYFCPFCGHENTVESIDASGNKKKTETIDKPG